MQIDFLKVFVDIVDLKSFSKSAEANYLTQPAVSHQIRKLEKHWKVVLIERNKKGIHLTGAGQIIYRESKAILERFNQINRLLGQVTETVSGTVRLAAIHGVGLHELPPYIKQFIKKYPHVNVGLEYMRDGLVYEQVNQRRADLGIVASPRRHPSLEVIPFKEDKLVIVCNPTHPLARFSKVKISKISGYNMVAFEKGLPTRKIIDQLLRKNSIQTKITMEFDNIETLKRAVEIDAGISILPIDTVGPEIEKKSLKTIELSGKPPTRSLGILVEKGRDLPHAVSKFIELLLTGKKK